MSVASLQESAPKARSTGGGAGRWRPFHPFSSVARWLHQRLMLKWLVLLGLTYGLTWITIFWINQWAVAAVEKELVAELRWARYTPPELGPNRYLDVVAITPFMVEGRVKKAEIGCLGTDALPGSLGGKDPPGDYWQADETLSRSLRGQLFPDSSLPQTKIEDPFDEFFIRKLRIPLQPILREKKLREAYDYNTLLDQSESREERERLLRHFGNVYSECMRLFPCRVIRWLNGWVQVAALAAFWLAVLIVVLQALALVRWEWRRATCWPVGKKHSGFFPFGPRLAGGGEVNLTEPPNNDNPIVQGDIKGELQALSDSRFDSDPGMAVVMLREVYESFEQGTVNKHLVASTALDQLATRLLRKRESDMAALVYLGWSLPSLGFVGTVLGLGTALLTAGDIVTPVSELQRDAIQTVSIYLGRAFDKTFVALLLSLVLMALIYWVRWAQEATVHAFQERIAQSVIPRLWIHPRERGR